MGISNPLLKKTVHYTAPAFLLMSVGRAQAGRFFDRGLYPDGRTRQLATGSMKEQVKSITAPTLVISGSHDPFGLEHGVDIAETIPGAELLVLQGMGIPCPPRCGQRSSKRSFVMLSSESPLVCLPHPRWTRLLHTVARMPGRSPAHSHRADRPTQKYNHHNEAAPANAQDPTPHSAVSGWGKNLLGTGQHSPCRSQCGATLGLRGEGRQA
jgi:hypothetical protein